MSRIRQVIKETVTPSWLESVPYNFGDPAAGTLKADEWRTMGTVYLPIALISLWGGPSGSENDYLRRVLDHTMALVSAVSLACMRTSTATRMTAYRHYMAIWVANLTLLHPDTSYRVNYHMAFHIYDFLQLFGPVRSWWCFPFERLIGILQRIPVNHKFGQLESTKLFSFIRSGKLKRWLWRADAPMVIKECCTFFDRAFDNNLDESKFIPAQSAFQSVPPVLHGIIKAKKVALRAFHHADHTIFSRASTHLGNSLVMFYPGGDRSLHPCPGSIQYIIAHEDMHVVYIVQRQMPVSLNTPDNFSVYPHFHAKLYSTMLSAQYEMVEPEWVMSHYARWNVSKEHAVVLNLSRVCLKYRLTINVLIFSFRIEH